MHYTSDYKLEILLIVFKHFSTCPNYLQVFLVFITSLNIKV